MSKTNNGATQYEHSMNHAVEFFAKAGSLFTNRKQHYGNESSALELFKQVWYSGNTEVAMKLLFWLRDPRGGAGNRSGFRECASWLSEVAPEWMIANAGSIPQYGRWDDLTALYSNDSTAEVATKIWAETILTDDVLAAKWANVSDKKLVKAMRKLDKKRFGDIGAIRRQLASARKDVVEVHMTNKEYANINYSHVPSVAMARYSTAFGRNDVERYTAYKSKLEKAIETGDKSVKINTGAIFPHDVIRTLKNGDEKTANLQFASLPNFMEDSNARIMTIADTSGSMQVNVSGSIQAIDIAQSLALYCSDKLGKDNPFYRKFMQFCDEAHLTDWSDAEKFKYISDVMRARLFNGAVGSTDIVNALNTILSHAKMFNASKEQMPTHLLIVSDMAFDGSSGWGVGTTPQSRDKTAVQGAIDLWVKAGFDAPSIIYWNTAGNEGSPETATAPNTALVSGFSPSILKAIFGNPESMNPVNIMMKAIEGYNVISPK